MRVLTISYYFPPVSHIATLRAVAFADYFPRQGIELVFATRHWTEDDNSWEDYFEDNSSAAQFGTFKGCEVVRLPFEKAAGYKLSRKLGKYFHRAYLLFHAAVGTPQPELNIYRTFLPHLRDYLSENRVDLILATFQPMGAVKLAWKLGKEFDIPFAVDFRDMWNVDAFGPTGEPGSRRRHFLSRFQEFHLRRWLKDAVLISAVNKDIVDRVRAILSDPPEIVLATNGYEATVFDEQRTDPPSDKFVFSVIGTLYPSQDLSIMLRGLKEFLRDKDPAEVVLRFVGLRAIKEAEEIILRELPGSFIDSTERVPYPEAVRLATASHVLFYAGWPGRKGITPGKIFDYFGARRNILVAPGDEVLGELLAETGAGRLVDGPAEFCAVLEDWFQEWKVQGALSFHGNDEVLERFTRENQTAKLARALNEAISRGADPEHA
ncbi:MAG: hypothetical protein IPM63_10330 [Acidobacteriota bacterium]|nr:MAG: hypothetical protein IPM63_10330 [Acidobacteriota bacterium]